MSSNIDIKKMLTKPNEDEDNNMSSQSQTTDQ